MMKSKDLIQRKELLQEQKKDIFLKINEMVADMQRNDLEKFIKTGDATQVNGHRLELLQRKRKHLENLEGSLNLEIGKARKKERESKFKKLMRKADDLESKRKGPLSDRIEHLLKKVNELRAESRKMEAEVLEITTQAAEFKREVIGGFNFRLPGLEDFLKQNFIAGTEELRQLVKDAYKENNIRLQRGAEFISAHQPVTLTIGDAKVVITKNELIRGFGEIELNRDSGKIEKIKPLTCTVMEAQDHPVMMKEVIKQ